MLPFADVSTSNAAFVLVAPIPTLLPETEIGELPIAEVPVKTGTVLVVPPEVVTVVCAAAATAIIVNPSQANTPFVIVQTLSIFHHSMRAQDLVHARFIFHDVKRRAPLQSTNVVKLPSHS